MTDVLDQVLSAVFEPGFFSSEPVHTALAVGSGAALVSGVVGVFTVTRGQSFAGHALADVSSAGGSAAFLIGMNPLLGFLIMAVVAAMGMELIPVRRPRERDLVTGVVLGAGLGLAALFLHFDIKLTSTTGAAITIMFGSMFAIPASTVPLAVAIGLSALVTVAVLYRPLLLSSVDPDLATVQGLPVRLVGMLHLVSLALAVALSSMTVGAILGTALLIGPAATALRLARRPALACVLAAAIGLGATWGGILLAYDSFYWTPGHGWPVSFFVVTLIFLGYLAASHAGRDRADGSGAAVSSGAGQA